MKQGAVSLSNKGRDSILRNITVNFTKAPRASQEAQNMHYHGFSRVDQTNEAVIALEIKITALSSEILMHLIRNHGGKKKNLM